MTIYTNDHVCIDLDKVEAIQHLKDGNGKARIEIHLTSGNIQTIAGFFVEIDQIFTDLKNHLIEKYNHETPISQQVRYALSKAANNFSELNK